jgi:uncharacterized protein YdbL (DUF1318 family)
MFRFTSVKAGLSAVILITALALSAPAASAGDPVIDTAKQAGAIGERVDGYLGVVDPAKVDAATLRRLEEINARRRAAYADIAQRNGTTVEAVAITTGQRQLSNAASGEFVMDESGRWVQR